MITILCDYRRFSSKKMAFFSKTNVMIQSLQKLALFEQKTTNFLTDFRRKYFENHNIMVFETDNSSEYCFLSEWPIFAKKNGQNALAA
jgi:D-lyxose ketol-isomerase